MERAKNEINLSNRVLVNENILHAQPLNRFCAEKRTQAHVFVRKSTAIQRFISADQSCEILFAVELMHSNGSPKLVAISADSHGSCCRLRTLPESHQMTPFWVTICGARKYF